jgi:PAS domain S-box-containing protein
MEVPINTTQSTHLTDDMDPVSVLEAAQELASQNEQRFRHLFENVPLCIFEVDVSSTPPVILAANRRAEAVYGWSAEELVAVPLGILFPREARPEIGRLTRRVRAGETVTMETPNRRRDGTSFPARVIATPEIEMGLHADHVVVAVEDITAEKQRRSEAEAIDEERRRIAQEIHDGIVQDMATLRLRTSVWHDLVDANPAQMHAELDELKAILDEGIANMRRAIFALRPVALEEVGLLPALRQLTADFEDQYPAYVDVHISGSEERLPSGLELALFRVVQEALHNVGKHAQASLVWLAMDLTHAKAIKLTIRDNGQGFDPASLERAARTGHVGLKQMRERVEQAQGVLEVISRPGQGTEVRAVLPLG